MKINGTMNLKNRYISPLFTILAMVLLLISRLISEKSMDWLSYFAIAVIIVAIVGLVLMHKKSK